MSRPILTLAALACLAAASAAIAAAPAASPAAAPGAAPAAGAAAAPRPPAPPPRPALFFKEEWLQNEKSDEHPVTQASVSNPNLEVKLYGTTAKDLKITGKAGDDGNPIHLFSGECTTPCAMALRHKASYADLTGLARLRLNTKMSGFHKLWPIIKLADGTWYIGDRPEGASTRDWLWSEFNTSDLRWTKFDVTRVVTTGNPVDKLDLTKVDEIGFADLMPASGHGPGGWFDLGQVEVYAKPVAR